MLAKGLLLDMDGVIVDFVLGAFKLHGKSLPIDNVRWDFNWQLGIQPADFWKPMDFNFWSTLEWTKEGEELLKGLEEIFGGRIAIVSSPCSTSGCDEGKRYWINKHMPSYRKRLWLGSEKFHFAAPNKILLDDNDGNVNAFCDEGGIGIVVPRPWNSQIMNTDGKGGFDVQELLRIVKNCL